MKVWQTYKHSLSNVRCASTNWRHVESSPPVCKQTFNNSSPPNSPTANIAVNLREGFVVRGKPTYVRQNTSFKHNTAEGSILKFDGEMYDLLINPVADESYQLMYMLKNHGFLQHREHFRALLSSRKKRFLITGDRRCGKTLTCYMLLINHLRNEGDGLVVPAIHLSHWFQDTATANLVHTNDGQLDFPEFNAEFLRFLVACNTFSESPNRDIISQYSLADDERWTSNIYSFKGDSLLNVAKVGITNPPVAGRVIQILFSTILDQNIPSVVIADNANLMSQIHSSKLENLRDLEAEEWWDQPPLLPHNITLLRSLKEFISLHDLGQVYLTLDHRNPISNELIHDTGNIPHEILHIPNSPSEVEYLQLLNYLRDEDYISRNMDAGEVMELTHLTGRNYPDTLKYMFMI